MVFQTDSDNSTHNGLIIDTLDYIYRIVRLSYGHVKSKALLPLFVDLTDGRQ